MTIIKKINACLKKSITNQEQFLNIINEIKIYFSREYNIYFVDDSVLRYYVCYLHDEGLLIKSKWEEIVWAETIDVDFIKFIIKRKLWKDELLDLFNLTKEEFEYIKNDKWDIQNIAERRARIFVNDLENVNDNMQVKFTWDFPKEIKKIEKILNDSNVTSEQKTHLSHTLSTFKQIKNNLTAKVVKELISEKVYEDEIKYVEVFSNETTNLRLYCYKSKRDYITKHAIADCIFIISFNKNIDFSLSDLNILTVPVENANLVKIKDLAGDFGYKIESSFGNFKRSVLLINTPKKLINAFNKNKFLHSDEMAFKLIKKSVENDYYLFNEYNLITEGKIGQSCYISKKENGDEDIQQKILKNTWFRYAENSKYNDGFVTDLKIKKISFDQKRNSFNVVCLLNTELKKHIKEKTSIFNKVNSEHEISLTEKEIIFNSSFIINLLPQDWVDVCNETDNGFAYLADNYFVTLYVLYIDQENRYTITYSFSKKYC